MYNAVSQILLLVLTTQHGVLSWSCQPCSAGVQDAAAARDVPARQHSLAADYHHQHVHHSQQPQQRYLHSSAAMGASLLIGRSNS